MLKNIEGQNGQWDKMWIDKMSNGKKTVNGTNQQKDIE
jgi:hypothetical protein